MPNPNVKIFEERYKHMLNRDVTFNIANIECNIMYDIINKILYYLVDFKGLISNWQSIFKYDRLDSDAFVIPKRFAEMTKKEKLRTAFVFIINDEIYYIFNKQLIALYENNQLQYDDKGELFIPVPMNLLTKDNPFKI